jgi:hypothetical protein
MPRKMLDALAIYETTCVMQNKQQTTEEDVKVYLEHRYGPDMAVQFKPEYLLNSRAP